MYREQVVRLGAQCTDYWTSEQSRGVGVHAVQLTTHVKSSALYDRTVVWSYGCTVVRSYGGTVVRSYGRTSQFFRLDGLLLFFITTGLRSASSAINSERELKFSI